MLDKLESMLQGGSSEPHNLPLTYLRNITNNFSDERLLGEGGFGTVYKGVLQNGETIAVKKLNSSIPGVKDRQFENEVNHLMRLKHPNVVLLVGWCSETENIYVEYNGKYICAEKSERLLCLEYMPKGSLRGYISDESSGLGWDTRYKIIEGICYGLRYLHEEWQPKAPIVHMDLKPANILLDNNMVPKIADFGLSRLFSKDKTWTRTISRDGTLGYMSPEYINRGLISTKSDIFSLGVIIIEIVTGRRDYPDDDTGTPSEEFIEKVLHNWSQRKGIKIFGISPEVEQISRCIQIGLDCVKIDRSKRPTISQIIKTLGSPKKIIKTVHGLGSADLDSSNMKKGFRFHPTDEELILYYLRNRAANAPCPVAIIADVDIYKFDPWDLPSRAVYGDKKWYFFSPRDRKYPNGIRPNRAAGSGYWKATGTDKPIQSSATGESVGVKKALVFYKGRPPKGTKTNWIMHEYSLAADTHAAHTYHPMKFRNASMKLDDWVLCRIYKKASHAPPMAVPPLSDHELQDEPCGFDENPYAATSAAMLLQGASFPALHAASAGAQRMPRIPSFSELFNDPSMLAHFFEEGGMQQDMARLGNQQQQHAPLLGRPITSQLLVNSGSSMSPGQIQQMDLPASTSAAGDGAAGKRKRSSEASTTSASAVSSQQQASAAKKPNGSK